MEKTQEQCDRRKKTFRADDRADSKHKVHPHFPISPGLKVLMEDDQKRNIIKATVREVRPQGCSARVQAEGRGKFVLCSRKTLELDPQNITDRELLEEYQLARELARYQVFTEGAGGHSHSRSQSMLFRFGSVRHMESRQP